MMQPSSSVEVLLVESRPEAGNDVADIAAEPDFEPARSSAPWTIGLSVGGLLPRPKAQRID